MTDIATDLKERFWYSVLWFLEKNEMYGVDLDSRSFPDNLTDEEKRAMDIAAMLRETVDAIPASLIQATEALRSADPELFEKTLVHGVQVTGFGFDPSSATEFLEVVNRTLERDMQHA
jgi:hypothetical protein